MSNAWGEIDKRVAGERSVTVFIGHDCFICYQISQMTRRTDKLVKMDLQAGVWKSGQTE